MTTNLKLNTKFFFTGEELSETELTQLLDLAIELKKNPIQSTLKNKTIAIVFEKPSLRTRVSFAVGIQQLGGQVIEITSAQRKKEEPQDTIRVLQGYVNGVMLRTHEHEILETMAEYSKIPIINGLSDLHHPCQILADLQTLQENFQDLRGRKIAYIGDGNNMLHSLLLLAPVMGMQVHYACPNGYQPDSTIVARAQKIIADAKTCARTSAQTSAKAGLAATFAGIKSFQTPQEAVADVDAIYTDVWTSMGFETNDVEKDQARQQAFAGYQVNATLYALAKPTALIMHCMPVVIDQEITREMMEHRNSVLFQQSENRLHAQKALMMGMFA